MTPARLSKFKIAKATLGPLSLSERLLLFVSRHPDDVDKTANYEKPTDQWSSGNALSQLEDGFPDFLTCVKNKTVLDYGCGDGFQSVAMAKAGAKNVLGVDIEENRLRHAEALAAKAGVENVRFSREIAGEFDAVISLNAMEHFIQPEKNIREMAAALKDDGKLYMSFGPLWMAPYGHHMHFFTGAPWINLIFSEKTIFRIRRLYRDDQSDAFEPGLNRMTLKKFHRIVDEAGLAFESIRYRSSGNLPFIAKIPVLRELLVNIVDAALVKRSN